MNTPERSNLRQSPQQSPHPEDRRLMYYAQKFNINLEVVRAALSSVGNDERLLEGFLRKNIGMQGH